MSNMFFIVYTFCGITDILDGYMARRLGCASQNGATLDSIADFIFAAVMLVIFIPIIKWEKWLIIWVGIIICIKLSSIIIGFIKYHGAAFLHTRLNKIAGIALFLFPFLYKTFNLNIICSILCVVASISSAEELAITIKSNNLNRDIKSIFEIKK